MLFHFPLVFSLSIFFLFLSPRFFFGHLFSKTISNSNFTSTVHFLGWYGYFTIGPHVAVEFVNGTDFVETHIVQGTNKKKDMWHT